MKKEIFKKLNSKWYLIILIIIFVLITSGIAGREYLVQRSIDKCYLEAYQRYEEAIAEVPEIRDDNNDGGWQSIWGTEDTASKLKLKEQLGEDEARCIRRYR